MDLGPTLHPGWAHLENFNFITSAKNLFLWCNYYICKGHIPRCQELGLRLCHFRGHHSTLSSVYQRTYSGFAWWICTLLNSVQHLRLDGCLWWSPQNSGFGNLGSSSSIILYLTLDRLPKFPTVPSLHLGNDGINLDFTKCMHFLFCVANCHTSHVFSNFTCIYYLTV